MVIPTIMGIINVTPDSFSGDGLLYGNYVAQAAAQARQMIADGAGILDIGGESSRPGATGVSAEEEIRRTAPVIAAIKKEMPDVVIAIDTIKSEVAEAAIGAGATMINDITALTGDPRMAALAASHKATVILMHNRAHDAQHSDKIGGHYTAPDYTNVVSDVCNALRDYANTATTAGITRDKIILDPGIGFGKTPQQNMALIKYLPRLKALGSPVLMGVSRKSFIGHILDVTVEERLEGTAACIAACVAGGADILRVHDVKMMARVAKMAAALRDA